MSHIVKIQTEVRDAAAVQAACRRLNLPQPVYETAKLFAGEVTGLVVQLPGWRYPVVCDLTTGHLNYDNFGGQWGRPEPLHAFLQGYAVEKAKIEARRNGHGITEQQLGNGAIKLTVLLQGGAA